MSRLKPVIVYLIHAFFSIYLSHLLATRLSIQFSLGMDGLTSLTLTFDLIWLTALVLWVKHEKLLSIFRWRKWRWSYLLWLLATFLLNRFVDYVYYYHSDSLNFVVADREVSSQIMRVLPTQVTVIINFLLPVIIAPALEEVFYRGYLMNTLFPRTKYYFDVILSALLFATSHLILVNRSVVGFALFTLMGLFLGFAYRFTKNLYLSIVCHMLFNFISWGGPLWIFLYNWIYYNFFR